MKLKFKSNKKIWLLNITCSLALLSCSDTDNLCSNDILTNAETPADTEISVKTLPVNINGRTIVNEAGLSENELIDIFNEIDSIEQCSSLFAMVNSLYGPMSDDNISKYSTTANLNYDELPGTNLSRLYIPLIPADITYITKTSGYGLPESDIHFMISETGTGKKVKYTFDFKVYDERPTARLEGWLNYTETTLGVTTKSLTYVYTILVKTDRAIIHTLVINHGNAEEITALNWPVNEKNSKKSRLNKK